MTYRVPLELVTRVNGCYNDGATTYKFIVGVLCSGSTPVFEAVSSSSILLTPASFLKGEPVMASVKKGTLTRPPQWWKHLREYKKFFWKSERQAYKKEISGGIT